ncbi:hypothetical protein A3K73_02485 [Candidatus Pacearchaeota archaeon RBG_13_36_9]|nr:MAG: hypothetical protein A3K73_02485 [Candidatus Pacearchaeota archaeon RBG_13_36_9]
MNKKELEAKYGKKLIKKIFSEGHLDGCTIALNKDGSKDIPESDIRRAIREINNEEIGIFDWD